MHPTRPRLIGSGTSPFVRKVRVALIEKGVEHDFDARSSWNPASPANVLNPLQKVPVLEWPGREPLFDSRVIVQALEHWVPQPALLPATAESQLEVLQLEALADGVSEAVALFTQEGWRGDRSAKCLLLPLPHSRGCEPRWAGKCSRGNAQVPLFQNRHGGALADCG